MKIKIFTISTLLFFGHLKMVAQNLPYFMNFNDDHTRLKTGGVASKNVFEDNYVHKFELTFSQSDYWNQLTNNYQSKKDIVAKLTIDGVSYDSVGVRFKGQTSYSKAGSSQKKSFNISMDAFRPNQDHQGYETFNLNNCFEDPSMIREITYLSFIREHIPAARGAFAALYINGVYWGSYALVQGLNGDFIEEWFLSDEGTRWRAERVSGIGGGGQNPFGAGTSSLNFLGTDTSLYKPNYTLKSSKVSYPWQDLMVAAQALNVPDLTSVYDTLRKVMDIDRALWFVGSEILFGDDDSYINKGGMDYYVYWDKETGRLVPVEYDGNSCMSGNSATWSLFLKENDTKFPLASRLFKIPELRQRYLAHARVLVNEYYNPATFASRIDKFNSLIDSFVNVDSKKFYTYAQFKSGATELKNYAASRKSLYNSNSEFQMTGPNITEVKHFSGSLENNSPKSDEQVLVTAAVSNAQGVGNVKLYFAEGLDGYFERITMNDKGIDGDAIAGDGIYSAFIPAFGEGAFVRYYIEAASANSAGTVSFNPVGAEHDVYIYRVRTAESQGDNIVINEIMASNESVVADQDGEFDDWIELYNKSDQDVDLSGWYLSDNSDNFEKYRIPDGTILHAKEYLIVWADEDGKQNGFHANFKLSASGENLYLLDSTLHIVDEMSFGEQQTDIAFARLPNGTGAFVVQKATFDKSNDPSATGDFASQSDWKVFPNPAKQWVVIQTKETIEQELEISELFGNACSKFRIKGSQKIETSNWIPGMYFLRLGTTTKKLFIVK